MLLFCIIALTSVVLDGIVVGMDMLIKKYGETYKGKKRLCLITDALHPIKDPDAGTKEDQVGLIASRISALGIRMENIVVRGSLVGHANQKIIDENDLLLDLFSKKSRTKTTYVDSPTSLLGAIKTRKITPVTIFRGYLEITPNLKIKVMCLALYLYLLTYLSICSLFSVCLHMLLKFPRLGF